MLALCLFFIFCVIACLGVPLMYALLATTLGVILIAGMTYPWASFYHRVKKPRYIKSLRRKENSPRARALITAARRLQAASELWSQLMKGLA